MGNLAGFSLCHPHKFHPRNMNCSSNTSKMPIAASPIPKVRKHCVLMRKCACCKLPHFMLPSAAQHLPNATLSLGQTQRRLRGVSACATRRKTVAALLGVPVATIAAAAVGELVHASEARAGALSNAWEAMGGGPSDLFFPDEFLGQWTVQSTLVNVELPMGKEAVPDMTTVDRAITRDLNQTLSYRATFVRNGSGKVVMDRRQNTTDLLGVYYPGISSQLLKDMVTWDLENPNDLELMLPGGGEVGTRVTRRLEDKPEPRRIETSEYMRQVFSSDINGGSRVKASQCFTKYKWRTPAEVAAANSRAPNPDDVAPGIVATQLVSDFLTPDDDAMQYAQAMGKPVAVMTYKMYFFRS